MVSDAGSLGRLIAERLDEGAGAPPPQPEAGGAAAADASELPKATRRMKVRRVFRGEGAAVQLPMLELDDFCCRCVWVAFRVWAARTGWARP